MNFYKDRVFWYIFAALAFLKTAALICLILFHPLGEQVLSFPDSLSYIYPAQSWLSQGEMWDAVSTVPLLFRTPGYPFFLALVHLATGSLTWGVALVQNLLSLAMIIPVYLTALRLGGQNAARWAAGFCAASVLYFTLSFAVLTETLCAFLLAWFIYFITHFFQQEKSSSLFLSAVFLAGAVFVRPAAYYFMFAAAVMLACFCAGKLVRFSIWKLILAFILPLCMTIGTWQVRNAVKTGFAGFTTVGAYNLYIWNEDFLSHKFNISIPQAHAALENALPPGFNTLPPAEKVRIYKAFAAPLIRESFFYKLTHAPLWAAKTLFGANFVHLARLVTGKAESADEMLNHTRALHTGRLTKLTEKILFVGAAGQVCLVVLLGFWGFWPLGKTQRAVSFFLAVYVLYFWGIGSTFFGAYARLRAPFEFVLCITAGIGISFLLQKFQTHKK